ncbi:ABC transporter permease [Candidatus Woesearchaeota archaeon]|nr:ABC transporter permease [Candidatus Woesearchaeota archaeon]MBW3021791.1 ABC transporter permease [Candidatus Woesearchaeota archaeon]
MALSVLIKKNFKLLLRAKSSSLIVILGPLLVIFLVGVAFDNANTYALNIGVYSEAYNDLTNSFVDALKENNFKVEQFESEVACLTRIKQGTIHTCITFPPNMQISNDAQNEIVLNVDYSKINLVWMVIDTLKSKVTSKKEEISQGLTEVLLQKLDETRVEIMNKNPTVEDLKNKNQELVTKANDVLSQVNSMDLSLNLDSLGISNLKTSVQQQASAASNINSNVDLIKDKLDELRDDLEDYNITNGSEIFTDLEIIEVSANTITNQTDGNVSWSSISSAVSSLDTSLQLLKSRLDSAVSAQAEVGTGVSDINTLLTDSKSKLEEVHSALQKIDASISGIEVTKASTIVSPISTKVNPVTPEKTHLNYIFPGLIVLVMMFIGILLSSTLVMMEKHSPAYFRNLITPVRYIIFFLGTYITNLITVLIQVAVILAISAIFFKAEILSNIYVIVTLLVVIATMFIFLGMLIGHFFKSEETSTLASVSIAALLLLLSDVVIPLESMPAYVLNIARFNPFVIAETALKRAIMFSASFKVLANDIYFMLGFIGIFFALVYFSQKISEKQYFRKFAYRIKANKGKLKKNVVKAKVLQKKEKPKKPQKKVNKRLLNIPMKKKNR